MVLVLVPSLLWVTSVFVSRGTWPQNNGSQSPILKFTALPTNNTSSVIKLLILFMNLLRLSRYWSNNNALSFQIDSANERAGILGEWRMNTALQGIGARILQTSNCCLALNGQITHLYYTTTSSSHTILLPIPRLLRFKVS